MFKEQGVYVGGEMENVGTERGDGHTTLHAVKDTYYTLTNGKIG